MGWAVGSAVGRGVGACVGRPVGWGVGPSEGSGVGASVGSGLGSGVGCAVGNAVGACVGWLVGSAVGSSDGPDVGTWVGRLVGSGDGSDVGPELATGNGNGPLRRAIKKGGRGGQDIRALQLISRSCRVAQHSTTDTRFDARTELETMVRPRVLQNEVAPAACDCDALPASMALRGVAT